MATPPPDDYYALLGVHATADDQALRLAWRRLAAQWHPDRAGVAATATFQCLSAAYTVLSDPLARAAYDRRRRTTSKPATTATPPPPAPPPTRPARPSPPAVMLSRLTGNLASLLARGAAHLDEPGYITLLISQAEAAQGGMARVSLNVDVRCPNCSPKGAPPAPSNCARCQGRRTVEELYAAWLGISPGVTAGEVLIPSADLPGMIEPVRFRVRFSGHA